MPLSGIVAQFAGWERRLEWLRGCLEVVGGEGKELTRSGVVVMDWLRKEVRTGYPEVEVIVLDLLCVAEKAWVRELTGWVLYGRLSRAGLGREDFLVQSVAKDRGGSGEGGEEMEYRIFPELMPGFVSAATANSILFVGRSLGHVKRSGMKGLDISGSEGTALLKENLKQLEALHYPISATSLSAAIAAIRSSLAQKALRRLLPEEKIVQLLVVLRNFFLLGRGEFAVALVAAADECLAGRHLKNGRDLKSRDAPRLGGMMIKEGEVSSVLDKTWASLAALQDIDDDKMDEELDIARDAIDLQIKEQNSKNHAVDGGELRDLEGFFEDALLATPTKLSITVSSPLDLFLTPKERAIYSLINAYLLSVRRAHLHLSGLWRLNVLRRVSSSQQHVSSQKTASTCQAMARANHRNQKMRRHWATVSSATFFLAELGEYLQGEVIASSWITFRDWINSPPNTNSSLSEGWDPEILTSAHRIYLSALLHNLLLTDMPFAQSLKTLITRCNFLVGLITRLSGVQEALEAREHGQDDYAGVGADHLIRDESEIHHNLAEVSTSVDSILKHLGQRLNGLDQERTGRGLAELSLDETPVGSVNSEMVFEPWTGGGVRNLLMRLDFRTILDD